ncbi:hypothetical protein D3C71_78960 [compost metagenome]
MANEFTFEQYKELDVAAKAVLVDGVADLRGLGLADETAIDTFEAKIASDLDPLPQTTYTELKARSEKALELFKELQTLRRQVTPDAHAAELSAIKKNYMLMGMRTAVIVGPQGDY